MFYNVENLFFPEDDSLKNDNEFTPDGVKYWSYYRYQTKLNKIAKTIIAVGEWNAPAIVGLCEVENIQCVNDLIYASPLTRYGYQGILIESGDRRGIDVAMIYRPDLFTVITQNALIINFPEENARPTRDILYVKGLVGNDTIHVFVNHWPSRYGGELVSRPKRNFAAKVLKSSIDSIQRIDSTARIVAMGDFNDHPTDESMSSILYAQKDKNNLKKDDLLNLTWQYEHKEGTHQYQGKWSILDQFIVNKQFLDSSSNLFTSESAMHIFKPDFLLSPDKNGMDNIPNRTYIGYKYNGGYSDHLPIYLDLFLKY